MFTQCRAVLCRVRGTVQSSTLQCPANHKFVYSEVQCSPVNWIGVNWHYIYFQNCSVKWLQRKEVQCISMNKNVDLCSAVECTATHPRLTKSPKAEKKSFYVFSCIVASFSIGREILCLLYAGFLLFPW